jgi:uncharacterized protein (TIGR03435 family)
LRRRVASISLSAFLSTAVFSQTGVNPTAFDAADVHVSPRPDWVKIRALQGGYLSGDRYELHRATMLDLIKAAYNASADRILGGPSWLDYDRYEVVAKTKPGTRPEALRPMLQTLLAERFKLAVKLDTQSVPAYVLTKGKGELKLKAATGADRGGCQSRIVRTDNIPYTSLECRGVTLEEFAEALGRIAGARLGNLDVVDVTKLDGTWDIDVPLRPTPGRAADTSIIEAVDKALGLKLELAQAPRQGLVVESVDERPAPNPAGTEANLPPLGAPAFEVASIRWPCNDNITIAPRFETSGRVTVTCMPLVSLIERAWQVPLGQRPAGTPKWLESSGTKYNISINAKAPANFAAAPINNAQAQDILSAMIQALLIDRYKMAIHYEDRPMDTYTLVAAKSKLTKADPANRTGCTRQTPGAADVSTGGRGGSLQLRLVCKNMTMAQWAEQIQAYDLDIAYPVSDGTGIEGAWDFTLTYNPLANLRFPGRGLAPNPDGVVADPDGAVSFTDAIERQMGLKLEKRQRSEPVLVIDHMEETPTEN